MPLDSGVYYGVYDWPTGTERHDERRKMNVLTIGQLARNAGMGVETVRFYERRGLIAEPARTASGYRQYPKDVVARLNFIRRAKELGFSLREIKELLELRVDPDTTCGVIKQRAVAKITEIEVRIAALEKIKQALVRLSMACRGHGPTSECPILDALDEVLVVDSEEQ